MNIFITGATGLIGRHLIQTFVLTPSIQLFALTRNQQKAQAILPKQVTVFSSLNACDFNNIDVVINLAGEPIADKRWTTKQKHKICQSRWQLTQQLADKINSAETPPQCFISGSAIGFYGRQTETKITESFELSYQEFTHDVCQTWENIALSTQAVTRVCILRTGIVLDKHQGALTKMLLPFKLGLGGPIGNGEQYMSWIHKQDMVNIITTLIHNQALSGIINATAPSPVTNQEFSKTLATILNRPCVCRVPKTVLQLLLGEMADLVLYGQNVVPEKLLNSGFKFQYPTLTSALENIFKNNKTSTS
ncbi:TIGR01777 family oxidoreductase [Thalassotalea agariperforans]